MYIRFKIDTTNFCIYYYLKYERNKFVRRHTFRGHVPIVLMLNCEDIGQCPMQHVRGVSEILVQLKNHDLCGKINRKYGIKFFHLGLRIIQN